MKRNVKYLILVIILLICFIPTFFYVKADNAYVVSIVKSNGNIDTIGTYDDYNSAKNAMNNYDSNSNNVATIYKNGTIINSRYATATLLGSDNINLYVNAGDSSAYTYTNPYYGRDAAFIDYDPNTNRVKIKISGFVGWTSLNNLTINPISTNASSIEIIATDGIRIRSDHGTWASQVGSAYYGNVFQFYDKYNDGTYTWYKIFYNNSYAWIADDGEWIKELGNPALNTYYKHNSSGNLIHYYKYGTSSQSYTNLGPSPNYLSKDVIYYSFDGNYFYTSLTTMLDDYRNNNYNNSINKNEPHFAYYLYLNNHSRTGYTADDFNQVIINKGYTSKEASVMYGEGSSFIESQETYGVNALLTFAAAINESATGTSDIARDKNNIFGHNANDSCPYSCATIYNTVKDSILAHARMTGEGYNSPSDWRYFGSHYGNKGSGMNVKYASDPYWGEKAAANAYNSDIAFGSQEYLSNTIGIKISSENIDVKRDPSDSSASIYTLKNNSFSVSNIPLTVVDKVYNNNAWWYKVYTDVSLDDNKNIITGSYSFDKSYGYIKAENLYVKNNQPVINVDDKEISVNSTFNPLTGVSATDIEDGNITNNINYIGSVNTSVPGNYNITYKVEDYQKFSVSKTITVTVVSSNPTINASDKEISQYTIFNPKEDVSAIDYMDGNITDKISVISNNVDINTLGDYKVKYSVTNSANLTTILEINIKVVPNKNPIINANDRDVILNSSFNPLENVSATDAEDGNITNKISIVSNNVDTTKTGIYQVTYKVVDNANNEITKLININVVEKVLENKEGLFYLDYIKKVDGKLQIKGYNTISGIDNVLSNNIKYKILFENIDTNEILEFDAVRITNINDVPRSPYSIDGKDYTYSWFTFDFDFSSIPVGNYRMYSLASSDDYYSKFVISNKLYQPQVTGYADTKNAIFSRNFNDKTGAIEIKIRNESLASKNASYIYNQYDAYNLFEIVNNKLHLKGLSYSYGADLSINSNVIRKIIFENKETFQTYRYDLGSITNGLYKAVLPVNDNLDKTRAWYDSNIDISNIPKGEYIIYITTTSNITDISELTEKLGRTLNSVTANINNKNYSFIINYNKGNRIEMIVE